MLDKWCRNALFAQDFKGPHHLWHYKSTSHTTFSHFKIQIMDEMGQKHIIICLWLIRIFRNSTLIFNCQSRVFAPKNPLFSRKYRKSFWESFALNSRNLSVIFQQSGKKGWPHNLRKRVKGAKFAAIVNGPKSHRNLLHTWKLNESKNLDMRRAALQNRKTKGKKTVVSPFSFGPITTDQLGLSESINLNDLSWNSQITFLSIKPNGQILPCHALHSGAFHYINAHFWISRPKNWK